MYYNNQYFNKHNKSKKLLQILLGVELVCLPVVLDHLQELLELCHENTSQLSTSTSKTLLTFTKDFFFHSRNYLFNLRAR